MKALTAAALLLGSLMAFLPRAQTQVAEPDLAAKAQAILKKHCAQCHGASGTKKGGMDYILDRGQLVERGQVVPGDPATSPLLERVVKGEMPPAKQPRLHQDEVTTLRQWIAEGAPTVLSAG